MGASGIIGQLHICVKLNYVTGASGHLHIVEWQTRRNSGKHWNAQQRSAHCPWDGSLSDSHLVGSFQLKRDGTRWRTGGEVKEKLANGVGSLHTTSDHGVSSITTITTADAHTSAASSRLNWRPCRFKWTRPFRRKTKSGFCACVITFQTQST